VRGLHVETEGTCLAGPRVARRPPPPVSPRARPMRGPRVSPSGPRHRAAHPCSLGNVCRIQMHAAAARYARGCLAHVTFVRAVLRVFLRTPSHRACGRVGQGRNSAARSSLLPFLRGRACAGHGGARGWTVSVHPCAMHACDANPGRVQLHSRRGAAGRNELNGYV
jgi:hypothetical protein